MVVNGIRIRTTKCTPGRECVIGYEVYPDRSEIHYIHWKDPTHPHGESVFVRSMTELDNGVPDMEEMKAIIQRHGREIQKWVESVHTYEDTNAR